MSEGPKMTTAQVARVFGVTERTVQRWADENLLPCTRTLGGRGARRFDRAVVEAALNDASR
jgi:excisionase family DNA binding protein